jgi:transposase
MPPEYVKCYVKAQKNDDRDAEGIVDAATRPMMRFVTLRSGEQLDIQSLHHTSDRLVGERTGLYRMAVTRSGSVFDALWVAA